MNWGPLVIMAAPLLISCGPLTDEVFARLELSAGSPVVVTEGAGVVALKVRLTEPAYNGLSLPYRVVGIDAQQDCQIPDFEAADGQLEWARGATDAEVRVWIGDDELAERDERFEVRVEDPEDSTGRPFGRVEVVVVDDDRSAVFDAGQLGVLADAPGDQSASLQAALDQAARSGRAVVTMVPGDYEISTVSLPPGTTLSAAGVRWHRPAFSPATTVSLRLEQQGSASSLPGLVEGLTIDGRREQQGAYRDSERQDAHLVVLQGDAAAGGVSRASLERVHLLSGTGSGLYIGPNADATVCDLRANELWRDALQLNGGATELRLRGLNATASQGTGLWIGAHVPGYQDSYHIDVEAEDLQIGAGDVEVETTDTSRVDLRRLIMTQPPFRLDAPGGSVRIEDSVIVMGVPSTFHNHWGSIHDVEVTRSTIIASETPVEAAPEELREFAAISVSSQSLAFGPATPGRGRLALVDCRFELASDVESSDTVYAVENGDVDAAILFTSTKLGSGFVDWFAPACLGCAKAL